MSCNDFGINLNSGTFRGYVRLSKECASVFDAKEPISIGKWYMVAVTSNGSHVLIFQNGEQMEDTTVIYMQVYCFIKVIFENFNYL